MAKYNYVTCEEVVSQYDDYDLKEQRIVPARYVEAKLAIDTGNPYIEALPYPRTGRNIISSYSQTMADFDYDKIKSMSTIDKILQIRSLRSIRFPLPFHAELELSFYNALITSYRSRHILHSDNDKVSYSVENQEYAASNILVGDSSASTDAGFSLIGYSGCGKSSAIQMLVSYYPQVIMHTTENGEYFPQITYLVVNCIPNSNFSALYDGIGDAIDKALGNIKPIYSAEIMKIRTLGAKAERIREYVEKFAIGIIIFDEIQLIDFSHTRENSFDSLLTLSNRTKVATAIVGTEDAKAKMFKTLRTARRVGNVINGNMYCMDKKFFYFLVNELFRYQWFDKPVTVSEEITDALYDVTKGIVDQLIGIYIYMNIDYLNKKKKPEINSTYIYAVTNKHFAGLRDVLENLDSDFNNELMQEINDNAKLELDKIEDEAKQLKEAEKILNNNSSEEKVQIKNVVANITAIYDEYTPTQIEDAFKKVIRKKSSVGKAEREISKLVIEQLTKQQRTRSDLCKKNTPSVIQMQNFLGIDKEDK